MSEEELRTCKKCGELKPLLDFPINNTLPSKVLRKHTCNQCRGHQSKIRKRLHKLHKKESNVCAICNRNSTLVLDHNHNTDQFRGWLCNDCNNALGKFGDDVEMLQKAINYLSKNLLKEI